MRIKKKMHRMISVFALFFFLCSAQQNKTNATATTNVPTTNTTTRPAGPSTEQQTQDAVIGVVIGVGVPSLLVAIFVLIRLKYAVENQGGEGMANPSSFAATASTVAIAPPAANEPVYE